MTTTDTTVHDHQAADPVQEPQRKRPSRRIGVLIGVPVALLGAVAATTLDLGADGADRPPVVSTPPAAYQPGGSVYAQQVPSGHDWSTSHGPGSYLHDAQVPSRR